MHRNYSRLLIGALNAVVTVAAFAPVPTARAQSLLTENFENLGNVPIGGWGPQGLIDRGWIFANNSQPLGPVAWVPGCCWESLFTALSGTGYLAAYQDSAAGGGAQYSAWAIVPAVPGQQAGDVLTFYTVAADTYWWVSAHLEVRYAPNGGANVGATATSVGDFTQTLLTISPIPNYNQGLYNGWTKWEVRLPGPGRIALRQFGNESLYFGVEDLSVAHPGGPSGPLPENFEDLNGVCGEGPCRLVDSGWIFRDQGTWSAGPAWEPPFGPNVNEFTPHSGFSFMKSLKQNNPGGSNFGSISTWAIVPQVSFKQGDFLSFFVRGRLGDDGVFEVRYSPTGGTDTGSGATGVGDFTQLLLQMPELSTLGWQHVIVNLPGPGRIALRSYDPHQEFYDLATVVAIDTMTHNELPPGPPLPQPGQIVTWTAAMSPIQIDTDLYIPPTSTVLVEPGVTIQLAAESTLHIGGTLQGHGIISNPIMIQSAANYPPGIVVNGTLDLEHTTINTQVEPGNHGSLLFEACAFTGPNGLIYSLGAFITDNADAPPFISINNSQFDGANLLPADATLRLTNTSFNNAMAWMNRGYWLLDNLSFTNASGSASGSALTLGRDQQNVHIDNIHVENAPGPAISVTGDNIGNDYFFGPGNVLVGNGYPAAATGGILSGSVLPHSGNSNNAVLVDPGEVEIRGPVNWHDPGIPYHVSPANHLFLEGEVNMHAGVVIKFPTGVAIRESNNFSTRGLPDDPVKLEPLGGQWWAVWTPQRMEHTVIHGSDLGVINAAGGLPGWFDNCIISNNNRGMIGSAVVRKSQFLNNGLGAVVGGTMDLNGQTNPNSFLGNGLAVQTASDARFNWWGHPTGPNGPQNPGGQGDPVASGVPVIPFRTSPPDASNHPPIVNMAQPYFAVSAGSTIILTWETADADVLSHRVLLSTELDIPGHYQVVADNLPATQRSFALTAPDSNGAFHVRVEAVDALGQVGWDRRISYVDNLQFDPDVVLPLPPGKSHFTVGHPVPIDPDVSFFDEGWVLLDGQMVFESFGAAGVLPTVVTASSDSVRLALVNAAGITFSHGFTVRPDERLGDAAPAVQLLSPQGGSLAGGAIVPISWSASDDEAVRSITIQASFDAGLTFHDVKRGLPGDQTSYNWQLPPLTAPIANVRLRVVVEDLRFQNSSAMSGLLTLTAGSGGVAGDINGDGIVNISDLLAVIGAWGACPAPPAGCQTDLNGDGLVDVNDLLIVVGNWS